MCPPRPSESPAAAAPGRGYLQLSPGYLHSVAMFYVTKQKAMQRGALKNARKEEEMERIVDGPEQKASHSH